MKTDAISQSEKADKLKGVATPGIRETKTIAEEGFIYGLPLVMAYGAMNAYSINRDSGAFTAPINEIHNEARVYTDKDVAIPLPNSDTPYSVLFMDLRAEPIILSVPAVAQPRYYSVMLCDFNTYNYGYIGSRTTGNDAGNYIVTGPDWQGETPKDIKKVFRSSTQFSLAAYRTQLLNADDMDNASGESWRGICFPPASGIDPSSTSSAAAGRIWFRPSATVSNWYLSVLCNAPATPVRR
jgi:hypothetical protein